MKSMNVLPLLCAVFFSFPAFAQGYELCAAAAEEKNYSDLKSYSKMVQGKEGWLFITKSDFKQSFSLDEESAQWLPLIHEQLRSRGIDLVVALVPPRGLIAGQHKPEEHAYDIAKARLSYADYINSLNDIGLPVVSLTSFDAIPDSFFYKMDHHWTIEGTKIFTDILAEKIKSLPSYSSIQKQEFETIETGSSQEYGSYRRVVKELCQFDLPKMTVTKHVTTAKNADPLSAEVQPEIVLIGTSYSDNTQTHANFDGLLKQKLSADILNVSVSGGGRDTSILSYLSSDAYKNNPPRIIIWEMPGAYDLPEAELYHQVLAGIRGDCGEKAILSTSKPIESGTINLFDDALSIDPAGHWVYLDFASDVNKFRFETVNAAGEKSGMIFKHSERAKDSSAYGIVLNPFEAEKITSLHLQVDKGQKGTVTARLCQSSGTP